MSFNPFDQEENFKPWFEQDARYLAVRKQALKAYIQDKKEGQGIFSFLHNFNPQLAFFLGQNALAVIIFGVVCMSLVGTGVAEVAMADEYKPSRLLQRASITPEDTKELTNQDIQAGILSNKSAFEPKPFEAVDGWSVTTVDGCNLAIRFKNAALELKASTTTSASKSMASVTYMGGVQTTNKQTASQPGFIECYKKNNGEVSVEKVLTGERNISENLIIPKNPYEIKLFTPATKSTLKTVYEVKNAQTGKVEFLTFEHRDLIVFISANQPMDAFQMQLNSLAPSTPSVTISPISYTVSGKVNLKEGNCMPQVIADGQTPPPTTCVTKPYHTKLYVYEGGVNVKDLDTKTPSRVIESNMQGNYSVLLASGMYSILPLDAQNKPRCGITDAQGLCSKIDVNKDKMTLDVVVDNATY